MGATRSKQPGIDVSQELREAVEGSMWTEVVRLVHSADCSDEQRHWAITHTVHCAPERFVYVNIDNILDCSGDQLDIVLSPLLKRRLWRCVGRMLQRDISGALHRQAVEESAQHADNVCFLLYILPHCLNEELEHVITHLVSRGLWRLVGELLGRGVSTEQHRWAVEQAIGHVRDDVFVCYILPQCHDEMLDHVITHLVSRGLWKSVGVVLGRGVSTERHRWAVEQAIRHAGDDDFVRYILPQCHDEMLDHVITHLVSRGLWKSVGVVLGRGVSTERHRWAVEQVIIHAADEDFVRYIPRCHDEELEHIITHVVSRGLWESVGEVLGRGVSIEQHRWADDYDFVRYILPQCHDEELEHVVTHLVSRGLWETVGIVLGRGVSTERHRWAVEQASRHAADDVFVRYILPQCHDEELEHIITHLVSRGLWRSVGEVLGRGVSTERHRGAVEQAIRHAGDDDFVLYILPHCHDEVMDHVITHLVSRSRWWSVGEVLWRGVSTEEHMWAVEQASRHAGDDDFVRYILPQCHDQELEHIITHLVSRGLWESVGEVLGRGVSTKHYRLAVEQAIRHAADDDFVRYIPRCHNEELEHVITHVVSRGLWESVGEALGRGVSTEQHRWAVEQARRYANDYDFVRYILPQCHDKELEHIITHLVSRGLWETVGIVLGRGVSTKQHRWAVEQASRHADDDVFVRYILPQCHDEELEHIITHLVSRGLWKSVGQVLGRGVSTEQHRWAVEQASRHADDDVFVRYILPQCHDEELEHIITYLVSRGLWKSVGQVLGRGVSTEQHRWAVEQAAEHADERRFADYILPQCANEQLEQVLTHVVLRGLWKPVDSVTDSDVSITQHVLSEMMSRGLWGALGRFLQRGISSEQHRGAVERAIRHASDYNFVRFILPQWHDEELDHVITHLVSRGLWRSLGEVLGQGVSSEQHRWAVEQAAEHADEDSFDKLIAPHCREADVVAALPILVANKKRRCTRHILYGMVSDTLHTWMTSGHDSTAHDTLFWKFIHHYRVDVSLALDLTKAVTEELSHRRHPFRTESRLDDFVGLVSWQKDLCEILIISLSHTLCYVMCSNDTQYTDSTKHTKQCVSDVYTHITACIADITDSVEDNTLKTIQNKQKWTSVFTEIADTHQTDPLSLLHFLQGLNLYHVSRRGQNDDTIFLVMMAVFPLFPQLQSVALRVMLREERWDVISQACLSHVWEHDRRRLFKAAVLQRQWSVVRLWSDHTVHDDEREWVMREALKEALKEKGFKEVCEEAFKEKVFKEGFEEAFKKAFKEAFEEKAFKQAFREAFKEKVFKDALKEAFKKAFKKKAFKEGFKEKAFNEKAFQEKAAKDDFKEKAFQEALKEVFKEKTFKKAFEEKTSNEAFKEKAFKEAFKEEAFKEVFKEETFKEAFKKEAFEEEALKESFEETFNEKALKQFFDEAFNEKAFISFKEAFIDDMTEEAFISSKEAFKVSFEDEFMTFISSKEAFKESFKDKHMKEVAFISFRDAFKESFKDEDFKGTFTDKWMVYLLLADHGLTPPEQMHAHYMVAKYGNWGTVKQMVERGGDLTEVSNLLENWVTKNLRKKPQGDVTVYMERCEKLIRTRLRFAEDAFRSPMKALERWRWGSVLYNILHEPTDDYFSRVLDKLIEEEEWHILMHLVRLGMNSSERNWLFPEMISQQQWGVCRMLLECGVDEQLCVEALPELMERNQWTLVARVMEYNVDDAVRRQVMQCAFHRRAGVLFWHCLNVMEDKQPLTKETRVKLFHQAISRDIWQAVKPLVEEKDGPGIQHRDMAFLEAIEQHLWDVVDYCQLHGADINMKDENGETPLHREARKEEWIAVKEIVLRDGKPNLLDKDDVSVLNRLIHHRQWGIVKFVIMYGGDIHLPAMYSQNEDARHTPLQALITARQADIIQFSIMWCGDQKKGVNDRGETCFHAVCDSHNRWDVMEDLIVRKVDPLAVTETGKSPLVYAVLNRMCPGRMVAECSRLGFSSHQPSVNGPQESLLDDIIRTVVGMWNHEPPKYFDCHLMQQRSLITSPLVCAVLRDAPVLVHMLYESASCSRTEVVTLYTQLPRLTDVNTEEGRRLHEEVLEKIWIWPDLYKQHYRRLTHSIEKHTALLRELDTTPRTLRSSCRLLILQHFHFSDTKRLQLLGELPLSEPVKDYMEYSDLRDPNYGKHIWLPSEDT